MKRRNSKNMSNFLIFIKKLAQHCGLEFNTSLFKGEDEYAILTNIIHQEWSGISVKKHKDLKGLKTQNLRDHMSEAELIFTALAELSTRQIAESVDATGMSENAKAGKKGGKIAQKARLDLEEKTGKNVVSGENFLPPSRKKKQLDEDGGKDK